MPVELLIVPEAAQDIAEAYTWYEDRRAGLGEEFLGCIDACVQGIVRTPEAHAIYYESFRRALVRRFPYAIFYEFHDNTVTIFSVFHTSQDPDKWRRRLS